MKSRVLTTIDPAGVDISEFIKPIPVDEDKLNAEIKHLLNPFIRWEKADTLLEGGMAVCRLASETAKFNKEKIKFVAGSGMFNRDIESAVIGMRVGESKTIELADSEVEIALLEATNRIVPELTDDVAGILGIDGVSSMEELRERLIGLQREAAYEQLKFEPYWKVKEAVLSSSEFVIAKEDWQEIVDERLNFLRVLSELEGFNLETATPEDFEGRIPVKSYHELVAMEQLDAWDILGMYLLGLKYAEDDGFRPTDEGYEEMIAEYCRTWQTKDEDARRINTRRMFEISEYVTHAGDLFFKIIKEKMLDKA